MIRTITMALCISAASLFGATTTRGTLLLMNDSPFILTASVYAQSGEYLGQVTIQSGEQQTFTTTFNQTGLVSPGTPKVSLTPYRVVWQCGSGEFYSVCSGVATASLVRATDCPGLQYCGPKKDEASSKQPSK